MCTTLADVKEPDQSPSLFDMAEVCLIVSILRQKEDRRCKERTKIIKQINKPYIEVNNV